MSTPVSLERTPLTPSQFDDLDISPDDNQYANIKIEKLKDTDNNLIVARSSTYRDSGGRICSCGLRKGSLCSAVLNLCGDGIGACTISIPYVFGVTGVLPASFINIISLYVANLTGQMMLRARLLSLSRSYEESVSRIFGPLGLLLLNISMIVLLYGACVGDIIELGDIMNPVTSMLEEKVSWMNRKFVISILWLFFIVPLALYDKTSELTFTSLLALVGSCFFCIVVVIYTCVNNISETVKDVKMFKWSGSNVFEPISIILFSYIFQTNVYSIHSDLDIPTADAMNHVNYISNFIGFVVYQVVGLMGYIAFPKDTPGNILNGIGMPSNPKYQMVLLAMSYVILGITILFAYPLNSIPLRYTLRRIFIQDDTANLPKYKTKVKVFNVVTTLIVCLSSLMIALYFEKVEVVFSLTGGIPSAFIALIFPAGSVVWLKYKHYEDIELSLLIKSWIVFIVGIAFLIYSIISTIMIIF